MGKQKLRNNYVQAALKVYTRADLHRLLLMWVPKRRIRIKTKYSMHSQAMRLAWEMLPDHLYVEQVHAAPQESTAGKQAEGGQQL